MSSLAAIPARNRRLNKVSACSGWFCRGNLRHSPAAQKTSVLKERGASRSVGHDKDKVQGGGSPMADKATERAERAEREINQTARETSQAAREASRKTVE